MLVLLEDDPGEYQSKLHAAIGPFDLDSNLVILTRDYFEERDILIDVKDEDFQTCIRDNAIAHAVDVVVLDNLGQFIGAEYSDPSRMHVAVKFLYGIARDANAAVII